jgi:endo-1,3(4)-beta-glucanase
MPAKNSTNGIEFNASHRMSGISLSNSQYTAIQDSDVTFNSVEQKTNYSDQIVAKDRSLNLKTLAISGIVISSALFFFATLYLGRSGILGQSLIRVTSFRQINHPEPPSPLWGTVVKPFPTGAFWTNLVIKNGDGVIGVYPYGIKTVDAGVQVSYGASRRAVSQIAITDPFVADLQIGSSQAFLGRAVEAYDNTSVTVCYRTAVNGKFRTHLVKGSPFITVAYENATPVISSALMKIISVDARVVRGSAGVQYIVTLGNFQKWLVYCSEPVALVWKENTLYSPNPIKGFIRVAILPVQNAEAAFTMLLGYVQKYATGAVMTLGYPTGTIATVNWQYTVVGNGPLLMLALPHHAPIMVFPIDCDENRLVQAAFTPVWSIKGKLKAVVGERWTLQYNMVQVGWNYALTDKLSTYQMDEIAKQLLVDVKSVIPSAVDPYRFGKEVGRMARLAQIADNLGIADARQQALLALETALSPWLQGTNPDALLYDKTYGGVVTTNGLADPYADFGSGWYSDHHFHYGYFAYAAATLAKLDVAYWEANKVPMETIIRDICNPDPTDLDFPFARHKDFFDGHSWASGLYQQANGKGQESSSEVRVITCSVYYSPDTTFCYDVLRFKVSRRMLA